MNFGLLAANTGTVVSFTGRVLVFLVSVVSLGELEEQRGRTLVGKYSFLDSQ